MGFIVEKDISEMNLILTGDIKHQTKDKLYQFDKTLAKYCEHTWEKYINAVSVTWISYKKVILLII